jgi:hypothetical protein
VRLLRRNGTVPIIVTAVVVVVAVDLHDEKTSTALGQSQSALGGRAATLVARRVIPHSGGLRNMLP